MHEKKNTARGTPKIGGILKNVRSVSVDFFTMILCDLCERWGKGHGVDDQPVGDAQLVVVVESAHKHLVVGGQGNSAHGPFGKK